MWAISVSYTHLDVYKRQGTYYDEKGIQLIATIPSREILLGKLLGSIQSPIAVSYTHLDVYKRQERFL